MQCSRNSGRRHRTASADGNRSCHALSAPLSHPRAMDEPWSDKMPKIIASCHCGATKLELPHAPESVTQCTCTYCTKSGGLWCYYEVDEVRVLSEAHGAV